MKAKAEIKLANLGGHTKRPKGKRVNYYIHREMAERLDKMLVREGKRNDIKSRSELIDRILSVVLSIYERDPFIRSQLAASHDISSMLEK